MTTLIHDILFSIQSNSKNSIQWGNLTLIPHDSNVDLDSIPLNTCFIMWHEEIEFYEERTGNKNFTAKKIEKEDRKVVFYPTIHISSLNHLRREECENNKSNTNTRYAAALDCSIWNYYYSFEQYFEDKGTGLIQIIEDICKNYNEGRYQLAVAQEYVELQNRIVLNSYLDYKNGHASSVSPFLFHSEKYMRLQIPLLNQISEGKEVNGDEFGHRCNWRFLLLDDHAQAGIAREAMRGSSCKFKKDIINYNLKRVVNPTFLSTQSESLFQLTFEFDCVSSVQEAEEKLRNKNKYDIILLDYKLDVQNGKQEYGYELLERIRDDQEGKDGQAAKKELSPGPNETFYFMFISAYTTAVQERLQAEGFYVSKDYWFIGRGACPTNTPYLFLYSLKRMMDIRYDKLTKHSKQLLKDLVKGSGNVDDKDIEKKKGTYATMIMFLTKLYEEGKERNNCVKGFNAFLNLRRVYDTIKHDVDHSNSKDSDMKSSPLIKSLFKDEEFCSNSFWEHLQNLVYLTAFGTIRQWPEMWEDYIFIKGKLKKAESEYESYWAVDKYIRPSILIRNYILNLKGMMS